MSRWEGKYVIGLTGNIAVGKSVVRQMLQHLGAYTIDADGLAHQAMAPGAPAYKPIIDTFGQFILSEDKTINRGMLSQIVFSNPEALGKLEAITHPVVGQAINTLIKRAKQPVVVIEAIKLIEGNLKNDVDAIWVVDASRKAQYTRLITKRKMSEEDAKRRILAQNPQEEKLKAANVVIKNEGNVEETWKQVQAAWKNIQVAPAEPTPQEQIVQPQQPAQNAAPAAPSAASTEAAPAPDTSGVIVKRGMPSNADAIANFINTHTGKSIDRTEVLMSFGQKSYLVAENDGGTLIGLVGWQVENLITRADELYVDKAAPKMKVVYALVQAIESASQELQSEVSFIFLPTNASDDLVQPFLKSDYEATTVKEIKIPAWREAVQEVIAEDMQILMKKLRQDRVLKPI